MCSALGKSTFLGECLHSLGWALLEFEFSRRGLLRVLKGLLLACFF